MTSKREHMRLKSQEDLQRLIRAVLDTPAGEGEMYYIDAEHPISYFKDKNTDMKTRIVVNQAILASNGSDKAAKFLFDYGGLTPPKEQHVTVEPHTFVDDITCTMVEEDGEPDYGDDTEDGPESEED